MSYLSYLEEDKANREYYEKCEEIKKFCIFKINTLAATQNGKFIESLEKWLNDYEEKIKLQKQIPESKL